MMNRKQFFGIFAFVLLLVLSLPAEAARGGRSGGRGRGGRGGFHRHGRGGGRGGFYGGGRRGGFYSGAVIAPVVGAGVYYEDDMGPDYDIDMDEDVDYGTPELIADEEVVEAPIVTGIYDFERISG